MLTRCHPRAREQGGATLILALIILVIMLTASAALMRSVDTSVVIAGNLAFKQAATASADTGIEAAIAWLQTNNTGSTLHTSIPGAGYLASRQDPGSAQSWDAFWTAVLTPAGQVFTLAPDAAGNSVSYVVHRLCNALGPPTAAGVDCASSPNEASTGNSKGAGTVAFLSQSRVYYRITCRVDGPRNTLSYAQAIVAM